MAIVLATTKQTVELVWTGDPAVTPRDPAAVGWIPSADADCGETATRVAVRALAGLDLLTAYAVTPRGAQCCAVVHAGVVTVDGKAPDKAEVEGWGADALLHLESMIEGLSRGPTVAPR